MPATISPSLPLHTLLEMESISTLSTVRRPGLKGFSALDPGLPVLASEVAIDIDNILLGKSDDRTAMHFLAEKLSQAMEPDDADCHLPYRMDMATFTVLGDAISEAVWEKGSKDILALLEITNKIKAVLISDQSSNNHSDLEKARSFCVALSRAAAAYSDSIRNLHPSHPYRR